jgi:AraC family transcriptional regulator of adaptative response/methylated-DNA-[protein]-cysteine methyltransferase
MENLDDVRWDAVQSRDERAGGVFVYAVRTTRVFCRPGCGARKPLRRNVEFFATAAQATDAGYRACRRCQPDQEHPVDTAISAVITLCRELEGRESRLDVAALASRLGYSERHLRRRFGEVVGVSIGEYARAQQAERARHALRSGRNVTEAALDAGFGSSRAFYEHGASRLGMTPGRYRDGGRGERIGYTSLSTPVGVVVAASTVTGVCSITIGLDESHLTKELASEFPNAVLERDDEGLSMVAEILASAVRGEGDPTVLPLDLQGTAFQIRVWEALRTIPSGQTRSYSDVATLIGAPGAVRAVGSACAANPAALGVPCHRVVRRDGSLGGYRWGLDTKEALLRAEAARQRA